MLPLQRTEDECSLNLPLTMKSVDPGRRPGGLQLVLTGRSEVKASWDGVADIQASTYLLQVAGTRKVKAVETEEVGG
ncbi:hypothetical protein AAFF_G00073380 [Aldrovandia affinis]|uniref:Uncharacterized protein n=1 Tax=Aldrovandia affinis TaxID=143900 RepID=A0AAD7RYH1_9TELE|nr:hypothetical protein AAFF_G00073380 [Aldrovandia affinis]